MAHAKSRATNSAQIRRETAQGRCERAESSGERNDRKRETQEKCDFRAATRQRNRAKPHVFATKPKRARTVAVQATKSTDVKRQPYSASTE
ncbi:MAG: hypothetical protein DBX56_02395 [Coriobacteriia bacterium]|nr:MAG: hypothetical protein DBX56_02395 [Coriobacteriia bacterium]